MALVDAAGDRGVAPGAEDGRGAGVGVDAGEVRRRQREAALRVLDGLNIVQEEGAIRLFGNAVAAPPKTRAQNLKRSVHVLEEGRQIRSETAVLEVEEAGEAPVRGEGLEEAGGGLVGVDAGGGEQPHQAAGLGQAHGPLHEERIEVDVAAAQQGVVAAAAHQLGERLRLLLGRVELGRQRVARLPQPLDAGPPGGGRRSVGERGRTRREPLHLLQLDPVPGRIADHGVEAAPRLVVLPPLPDPREGRFPVQEAFPAGDGVGAAPQLLEGRPEGPLLDGVPFIDGSGTPCKQPVGSVLLEGECPHQGLFELGAAALVHRRAQPAGAAKGVEHAAEVRRGLLDGPE